MKRARVPDNPMARSGMTALLLRLVPGATSQPENLAKRRLVTGLTVVVVSVMLQTLPTAIRAQQVLQTSVRFSWWLVEMLVLTIALSTSYDFNQRRRAPTFQTLVSTLVVAAAVSAISVLTYQLGLVKTFPFLRGDGPPRTLAFSLTFGLVVGILHTGVWALAFVFPYVAEDARLRAVEADKLRIEADQLKTTAELARLRSQLEPHFLLNTLNAIAGLVTENPREARRLIACLGDLLRDSLTEADEMQALEDEVTWLKRYAEILESRHAGTLTFVWEIDQGAKRALLPRLLLQPLVENAVKHGALRRREKGGLVTVRASVQEIEGKKTVVCIVEDNGPGLPDAPVRQGAFGLHSVRRRLALKFPEASLRMESTSAGTRSIVELPSSVLPSRATATKKKSNSDAPSAPNTVAATPIAKEIASS